MKIAFFGASVTAQSGEGSYLSHLRELLPQHEILQFGFGACHFNDAGFHKLQEVLDASPGRVILEWNTTGLTTFNELKLGSVVRQILEHGALPCFLVLPRRDSLSGEPRPAEVQVRQFCRSHQIPLLDLVPGFSPDGLLRDMVHTTPEGAVLYAERIAAWLAEDPPQPLQNCLHLPKLSATTHPFVTEISSETALRICVARLGSPLEEFLVEVVVGPNMVDLQLEAGGQTRVLSLVDRWCYYERRMFHPLWDGSGTHTVGEFDISLRAASALPDYSMLEKPRHAGTGRASLKILTLHFAGVEVLSVQCH